MKKVVIIGAGGSLASVVIQELKKQEAVALTLFVRNGNRIADKDDVVIIEGDATNLQDLLRAISGQDIVYINLAGNLELMTANIVKAMHQEGVQRVIAISSIGIYEKPLKPVLVPYR
ncbi:MAG: NAD-dependent epimerase/dehydratase family protein, partial [Sphingobacteriales bacterium]